VGDGEVYETVTLNAANNWRHTWEDLDASVEWRVVEKEVPAGYSVVTELENTTFVITNTELTEEPTTEEPTTETTTEVTTERSSQATTEQITETTTEVTTEKITEQVTEATTEVTTYNTTETPTETTTATNKTTETKLPQTGMLRWPIPFLTGAGLLLFVIGWIRYRKYSHGDGVNEKKR
jgi:hypothetical protein